MKTTSRSIRTLAIIPGSVKTFEDHEPPDQIYVSVPLDLLESAAPLIEVIRPHFAVGARSTLRIEALVDDSVLLQEEGSK